MVVRPYPGGPVLGQPQAAPQTVPIQPGTPVTVPAPSVHLPQGQPAVLTEGQMKVTSSCLPLHYDKLHFFKLYPYELTQICNIVHISLTKVASFLCVEITHGF